LPWSAPDSHIFPIFSRLDEFRQLILGVSHTYFHVFIIAILDSYVQENLILGSCANWRWADQLQWPAGRFKGHFAVRAVLSLVLLMAKG
jgi:hypothetical protein